MQITESQLRQTVRTLLKEEVYGTIATVYHGSKQPPEEFIKLFENESGLVGWETGKGAGSAYGHGLYTVWKLGTGHNTDKGVYGDWIYKFKVNLNGFIVFDDDICRQVYGSSLTPLEQLKKLGKKELINKLTDKNKRLLSEPLAVKQRSAEYAAKTSMFLAGIVNGIVFWGSNDGPVVIAYDPNIVTPIGYAKLKDAKLNNWTRWNPEEMKHSLRRSAQAGTIADPERLQNATETINQEKMLNFLKKADYKKQTNINLLKNSSNVIKSKLATDNLSAPEVLFILSDDDDKTVRMNVAYNASAPPKALEKLSDDKSSDVRYYTALNKNMTLELLIKMANDSSEIVREAVASNSSAPPKVLEKLSDDENAEVRNRVAANKNTPLELLIKMAGDSSEIVRQAIAGNPLISADLLMKLSNDKDENVRSSVVSNPKVPKSILIKMANDADVTVRMHIAMNPATPKDVLEMLADDDEWKVRRGIPSNKSTPPKTLEKLSNDIDSGIRVRVAANKKTPLEALIKMVDDKDWRVRAQVARKGSMPEEILKKLSKDKAASVRKAAIKSLNARGLQERKLRSLINKLL
jgi:hypothetical protein